MSMKSPPEITTVLAVLTLGILLSGCDRSKDEVERLKLQFVEATNSLNASVREKGRLDEEKKILQEQLVALTNSLARIETQLQVRAGEFEMKLQVKDREIDDLRKQIAANVESRELQARAERLKQSRAKAWENLNRAFFIGQGLQVTLCNYISHEPRDKWRETYDT